MASPFPGMDPYLEQFWGDVHQRLVTYACDQLQGTLPGDLRARIQERVFVESPTGPERNMYPDIRVVERGRRHSRNPAAIAPVTDLTYIWQGDLSKQEGAQVNNLRYINSACAPSSD